MTDTEIEASAARANLGARWVELLSSMRFAISALAILAIASSVGTVLVQNQAPVSYVNQFGAFWADAFRLVGLDAIYSATWFWIVLGFLLASTSLCVLRNTPKMIADMRSWRDKVRRQSLQAMGHKAQWDTEHEPEALKTYLQSWIAQRGYQTRAHTRETAQLITAKRGGLNRLGYIFTHTAIIVICLGGMLDSDLPLRLQVWFGGKTPVMAGDNVAEVPASAHLGLSNPSYRASVLIPEGKSTDVAVINWRLGSFLQDLPFEIHLKRFIIDYYPTGMPKLFASEVTVRDPASGESFDTTIKVNHPLHYKGLVVYQSSFEDGGTQVKLKAHALRGPVARSFDIDSAIGQVIPLSNGDEKLRLELTGFRAINVEDMGQVNRNSETSPDSSDKPNPNSPQGAGEGATRGVGKLLEQATQSHSTRDLRNVGPSVQYKLRDQAGQAREFSNYMQPILIDDQLTFVAGVRDNTGEGFRYWRIPADDRQSLSEFFRLRAATQDPALRAAAARAFAVKSTPAGPRQAELREQLQASAEKALKAYAEGGYQGLTQMLQRTVPEAEWERAAEIVARMLQAAFWELWQQSLVQAGLPPRNADEANNRYAQLAMNAISETSLYDAPVLLTLESFEEVKATVLQVARAPGKNVVYLGCLLLVLGVFAMLYIRERRVWIWIEPRPQGGSSVLMAASTQRGSLDFDREFEEIHRSLQHDTAP